MKSRQFFRLLFPSQPRSFPYRRVLLSSFRALHILSTGVLIGGHVFNQPVNVLEPWLYASVITGLLLFVTDLHASMTVLFELRGLLLFIKVVLLLSLLLPAFWEQRLTILTIVLFIGVIGSHMPKRWRHKVLLFENHIVPDERSG